jgi:hypothetical protein
MVVSQPEKGENIAYICHNIRCAHSSICTIHDVKKIKQSARLGTEGDISRLYYSRSPTTEHTEKVLNSWLKDQNQCHMPVKSVLVQAKALSVYENLSKDDDDDDVKPFSANTC